MSRSKSTKAAVEQALVAPAAAAASPAAPSSTTHAFWSQQPVVASAYRPPPPSAVASAAATSPSPAASSSDTAADSAPSASPTPDGEQAEGVIDPLYLSTHLSPFPLPPGFEWSDLQLHAEADLSALHQLLRAHYVEDSAHSSRVDYSPEFLQWALTSPTAISRYHVGVRLSSSHKLVAFIAGTRQLLRLRQHESVTLLISFLCVHAKLRRQRLAPVLIKEVTRRISVHDTVKHAVYTAGALIHQPLTHATYYHRPLNVTTLVTAGFIPHPALLSTPPPRTEVARTAALRRFVQRHALPDKGSLPELRLMTEEDVPAVHSLLRDYLSAFSLQPVYDEAEVRHWFLPRPRVVYSYVLYEQSTLVAFASFQDIPRLHQYSTGSPLQLRTANASYHICRSQTLSKTAVMRELLGRAKAAGFDVYSALDVMDAKDWMEADGRFLKSNGGVYYYLFNYQCPPMTPQDIALIVI